MTLGWLWLVGAIVLGGAAYALGWPAWRSYRGRESRDANVDRYLAWRGRAARPGAASLGEGVTGEERRRLILAGLLAAAALVCLVLFFALA